MIGVSDWPSEWPINGGLGGVRGGDARGSFRGIAETLLSMGRIWGGMRDR